VKYTNWISASALRLQGPVEFRTTPWAPAIFTSESDNTAGEVLPWSTGNPTNFCGNPALEFNAYAAGVVTTGQHLRVSHAYTGISFYSGYGHEVRHAQVIHSQNAFQPYYAEVRLRDVLVSQADTVLSMTGTSTGRVEHLTANVINQLSPNTDEDTMELSVTNSLFVSVTNLNTFDGAYNSTNTSGTNIFTSVGAGNFYLQPTFTTLGTTNISAQLFADLKTRTTRGPTVLTNTLIASTNLAPIIPRGATNAAIAPTVGYWYPAVDYAISLLAVTNATLTLLPGTVVAGFGNTALLLQDGSTLVSEGTPMQRIRFVRYSAVQEQSIQWGATGSATFLNPYHWTSAPSVRLRFSEFSLPSGGGYHIYSDAGSWSMASFSAQDCTFCGASIQFSGASSANHCGLTNNLFERIYVSFFYGGKIFGYNNLFKNCGEVGFDLLGTNVWTFRDNVFDSTTVADLDENVTHSHNAYISTNVAVTGRLQPPHSNDVVLTNFTYAKGPLGDYYQVSTNLIDAGSRYATNAGLYQFTTGTNEVLEGASMVDIGLHFPAAGLDGLPIDTDGDGLPDAIEDANGNGIWDAGETDPNNPDTDGDGLTDYEKVVIFGRNISNPLLWDTDGNGVSDADEDYDHDGITNLGELRWASSSPIDAFFLNRAFNGNAVMPDASFLCTTAIPGQPTNSHVTLSVSGIPGGNRFTLNGTAGAFLYDIYLKTNFFGPYGLLARGQWNQTNIDVLNAPNGYARAGWGLDRDGTG
jgi:hypothetical protein